MRGRYADVDQWQCMLVLSKTYSSITIGLIKLVRVEYVLGRQIESIHYLISRSKCMQCKSPKARQSRDPDWCVQGTSLVNKQARCIRPRARGRSHVGTAVLGCHHGMQ